MYWEILLHQDHQKYQIIHWRQTLPGPIHLLSTQDSQIWILSAPILAIRTLQQLAKDEGQSLPWAAKVLTNDIFVDDIVTGTFLIENAMSLKHELVPFMKLTGFEQKNGQSIIWTVRRRN